jgi:hypothetical protein
VCKKCETGVVMGKATPKPIEGGRPGPGLLAKLLVEKFDDSTPLYRQAKEWRRLGIELSTSTMGDWAAGGIDLLEPLWKYAKGDPAWTTRTCRYWAAFTWATVSLTLPGKPGREAAFARCLVARTCRHGGLGDHVGTAQPRLPRQYWHPSGSAT